MLSHGAGLALCVALALSEVKRGWGGGCVEGGSARRGGFAERLLLLLLTAFPLPSPRRPRWGRRRGAAPT